MTTSLRATGKDADWIIVFEVRTGQYDATSNEPTSITRYWSGSDLTLDKNAALTFASENEARAYIDSNRKELEDAGRKI